MDTFQPSPSEISRKENPPSRSPITRPLLNSRLVTLTAVPQSVGSNPGEGINICKCMVCNVAWEHSKYLSCRQSSRAVEGRERVVGGPPTTSQGFSLKFGVEPSQIVLSSSWCLRLTTAPCREKFHWPRSITSDQVALAAITRRIN
ncbi:hypothetical protein TNCV_1435991 [Trichonephila clavipes]|nr:hypothetical protein TNCV_1435991 [Trichonephila clavipes]